MLDPRFVDTVALIEASSTEQFFLWKEFHTMYPWQEDPMGFCYVINGSAKRPINLCFSFATVGHKRICFYDCVSELVDWAVIEDWRKKNFPNVPHCNAMNFHQALHVIYPDTMPKTPVKAEDLDELARRAREAGQDYLYKQLELMKTRQNMLENW